MSNFYLEYVDPTNSNNLIILEMSSTTNISVTEPANVTHYPVEDGSNVIDNYVIDNRTATFNGVITNIRVLSSSNGQLSPEDWIVTLRDLRQRKQLVNTHISGLDVIPNCVITNFEINKTKDEGLKSWKCKLVMKEVDISERVKVVSVKKPIDAVSDEVAAKSKTSGSSTTQNPLAATSRATDLITTSP